MAGFLRVIKSWLKSLIAKVSNNRLTLIGAGSLLFLSIILTGLVISLFTTYSERVKNNRAEIIDRDLKDIVGQFDVDERYVLNKNVDAFLYPKREFSPLLLPRQYYVSLPSGNSKFTPRQPPRNCFVKLSNKFKVDTQNDKQPERFCAYFAEPQNVGKYLFLSFSINDKEVIPLRRGDTSFSADGLKIRIDNLSQSGVWWIYLQNTANVFVAGRYQITAYKEKAPGVLELDKRFEGWAYEQAQSGSLKVVNILARIDFKSFISEGDENWPPNGWRNTSIKLERNDKSQKSTVGYEYPSSGETFLSIPSISKSISNSFANLSLILPERSISVFSYSPEKNLLFTDFYINDHKDLLKTLDPILERSLPLQDTDVTFKVTQPHVIIEKTIWQTLAYTFCVTVVFVLLGAYLFWRVMLPIFVLARRARQMVNNDLSALPYADRKNEIGDLSGAFNDLLKQRETQAAKRANQERDARIKSEEEMKSREATIQFIGHEIRSPLQSLAHLHAGKSNSSSRYIERMTNAINTLENISGPNSLFSNRKMYIERVELGSYLEELAANCDPEQFPNVDFDGPTSPVFVSIDDTVLEDAITNILNNANRHRQEGTNILIKLRVDGEFAVIDIFNNGPHIPEESKEEIFELGYSTRLGNSLINKGIGLHAVKQYISRLNGTVHVENVILGVSFVISIPIMESNI